MTDVYFISISVLNSLWGFGRNITLGIWWNISNPGKELQPVWDLNSHSSNVEVDLVIFRKNLCPVILPWHFLRNRDGPALGEEISGFDTKAPLSTLEKQTIIQKINWKVYTKHCFLQVLSIYNSPYSFQKPFKSHWLSMIDWGVKTPLQVWALVFKTPGKSVVEGKGEGRWGGKTLIMWSCRHVKWNSSYNLNCKYVVEAKEL